MQGPGGWDRYYPYNERGDDLSRATGPFPLNSGNFGRLLMNGIATTVSNHAIFNMPGNRLRTTRENHEEIHLVTPKLDASKKFLQERSDQERTGCENPRTVHGTRPRILASTAWFTGLEGSSGTARQDPHKYGMSGTPYVLNKLSTLVAPVHTYT